MMALEADRLSFSYGEAPVLSCASFGLAQTAQGKARC